MSESNERIPGAAKTEAHLNVLTALAECLPEADLSVTTQHTRLEHIGADDRGVDAALVLTEVEDKMGLPRASHEEVLEIRTIGDVVHLCSGGLND